MLAAERLRAEGHNELPRSDQRTIFRIVLEVIRQPMFALLLIGGAAYLMLGDFTEAVVLLLFASLSVVITVVQETRSEKVLDALRDLSSPRALVIRDGERIRIAGRDVVREDLVVMSEGDRVPADGRLIASQDMLIDESLLTGESVPVRKSAVESAAPGAAVPGGDDQPFVFAGSLIVRGSGTAQVTATGAASEIGKIGKALGAISLEQPRLQQQIRWVVRDFAVAGVVAGALVVLLYGLLRGSWLKALLAGIAIGMSLLPEEFPLVLTVFMAMGAWRISRARVLTRRAATIETLGAATVLCTDKTGTLTENHMSVAALVSGPDVWLRRDGRAAPQAAEAVAQAATLGSDPDPSDPMERAMHEFLPQLPGLFEGRTLQRVYGLRPDLFAMTNVWKKAGGSEAYAKGAPEAIAGICRLDRAAAAAIAASADALAQLGMRVLGVARADVDENGLPEAQDGFSFRFIGLIGFADPLRANVPDAVRECRSAGIRVVMITGDYPNTARAIAAQAGIESAEVLTGDAIEAMNDAQLAQHIKTVSVFARIRPAQKLRIVEALKANGEVVAMTGDGVNDAPAMKAAHIGVAMGGRGTDVAREASSIVLLDDDFGSIVKTVRLGRRIYDNLRKAMQYIVAIHIPIAGMAIMPLIFGYPLILTPIHIAFLEMVIDPACSIVFEAEEEEGDIMRRPPRDPASPLLSPGIVFWALAQGVIACIMLGVVLTVGSQRHMAEGDLRALVFTTLVMVNLGLILVNRSFRSTLAEAFFRPNRSLWLLVSAVVAVMGVALFSRAGRSLFQFGTLHTDDLLVCAACGGGLLLLLEMAKHYQRRFFPQG